MKVHASFLALVSLALLFQQARGFKIPIHKDITEDALKLMKVTIDGKESKFTPDAIDDIQGDNADVDYFGFGFDYFHFDNEQFAKASKRLKEKVQETVKQLKKDPPNGAAAREAFAEGLHTLQDFYSHSSWIEAGHNNEVYPLLGREELTNPSKTEAFCPEDFAVLQIPTPEGHSLTSGYFSTVCLGPPTGKCQHGSWAGCGDGINKDEKGRKLHAEASATAKLASIDFFEQIVEAEGVKDNIDAIRAFMGLKGTLAIVIDTTGSMGPEIAGVRQIVSRVIEFYRERPEQPPDYVLVPFNDPSIGPVTTTSDPDVILAAVNSLSPSGGGDCPEMAFGGLLAAIENSDRNSRIFFFSDASAKDGHKARLVSSGASRKNIAIIFVLTGSCSPVDPNYIQIAEETGGQVFFVGPSEVESIFDLVLPQLEGNFVTVARSSNAFTGVPTTINFAAPIDSTMTTAIFSVSFTEGSSGTAVELYRPSGELVSTSDPNVTIAELGDDRIFSILVDPSPGIWTTAVTGTGSFSVVVQGNSPVDLNIFRLVSQVQGRYEPMYRPITGNPVAGHALIGIAKIFSSISGLSFGLVDSTGEGLTVEVIVNEDDPLTATSEIAVNFISPDESFSVFVSGTDDNGYSLQRLSTQKFVPQIFQITFDESSRPNILPAGTITTVDFKIENFGDEDITIVFSISDTLGYIWGDPSPSLEVGPTSQETLSVDLRPTVCVEGTALIITVAGTLRDDVLGNSETVQITTGCNSPPDCGPPVSLEVWPPNNKMVDFVLSDEVEVTDPDGDALTLEVLSITQDEEGEDYSGIGTDTASILADRDAKGDGRTYIVDFEANDGNGGACTGELFIKVPHDKGKG
jgi:hypothetical protein